MFESVLQDITFSISDFKTQLHLAHLKQYPEANCPEYNEISANLQHCQQSVFSSFLNRQYGVHGFVSFMLKGKKY